MLQVLDEQGHLIKTSTVPSGQQALQVEIPGREFPSKRFKIVYILQGKAKAPNELVAGINAVQVEAEVKIPKSKGIW